MQRFSPHPVARGLMALFAAVAVGILAALTWFVLSLLGDVAGAAAARLATGIAAGLTVLALLGQVSVLSLQLLAARDDESR